MIHLDELCGWINKQSQKSECIIWIDHTNESFGWRMQMVKQTAPKMIARKAKNLRKILADLQTLLVMHTVFLLHLLRYESTVTPSIRRPSSTTLLFSSLSVTAYHSRESNQYSFLLPWTAINTSFNTHLYICMRLLEYYHYINICNLELSLFFTSF